MKHRSTQLGVRKNPDSPRVHGLRLAVNPSSLRSEKLSRNSKEDKSSPPILPAVDKLDLPFTEATCEGSHLLSVQEVAELLQVPSSWVYEHRRPRCGNPLPHMRIGKYLRFLMTDIANYLQATRPVH